MRYKLLESLEEERFRRLTGVKWTPFEKMGEIVREVHRLKKMKGGRNRKLCSEDMVLMTLEYLREYRTYFHISQSYGVSESTAYKIIRWVEDTLIKHPSFALPGRQGAFEKGGSI